MFGVAENLMIPQDFIQTLLSRVDIVDVVGRYVPLKKAGANFQACCPFHQEKSPSFTVSPTKQFYHCFGCGAHGSVIGFLMEYSGVGYVEAIRMLADQSGMQVPESDRDQPVRPRTEPGLTDLMLVVSRWYRQQLKQSSRAIAYLKQRGLTGEIAARFGLGYAPDSWQGLAQAVKEYDSRSMVEVGLVVVNDNGRRYDRFRDRIMFPIHNTRGDVIGFGGRILDQGEPKYLNSPETPLFQKGQELYGLFQARQAIRSVDRVLVVEGYMDVVALSQHGIDWAVATLGTATTPTHVKKLLRHTTNIVFCFDGDAAGQRAAWRALEQSLPVLDDTSRLMFLFLPEEHDPDSYVRAFGRDALVELIDGQGLPLSAYLFRQMTERHDLQLEEGRSAFLKELQPLLAQIQAPALALLLRKRAAELTGLESGELAGLWKLPAPGKPGLPAAARGRRPAPATVNHKLLRLVLFRPDLAGQLKKEWITSPDADGRALARVLEILAVSPNLNGAALAEACQQLPEARLLAERAAESLAWDEAFDVAAEFDLAAGQARASSRQARLAVLARKSLAELSEEEREELRSLR